LFPTYINDALTFNVWKFYDIISITTNNPHSDRIVQCYVLLYIIKRKCKRWWSTISSI